MLFNSYIFILFFLPMAIIGFFGLNYIKQNTLAKIYLIACSLWFYGYFNPWYLWIISGSVLVNYGISKGFSFFNHKSGIKKLLLFLGVIFNLALIFYFKYYDFFIENINVMLKKNLALMNVALPLGISFFTFQQISFVVDSYRQETKQYSFVEYALFVTFFPQLVAGPIVSHDEIIPQFQNEEKRHLDISMMNRGICLFVIGLFKKVLIADTFGNAVNVGWESLELLTSLEAILVSLFYTFQIYFDFSGYCDMASGIASMFNIELPLNFNSPYKAESIIEFWKRWHITLTRFLRKYIYFPLGGSRKGEVRAYVNVLVVFLLSGVWHGAGWTFIIWGILHGGFYCLTKFFDKYWNKLSSVWKWVMTFGFVNMTWIIFRAETMNDAFILIRKIIKLEDFTLKNIGIIESFRLKEFMWIENTFSIIGRVTSSVSGFYMWLFLFGAWFCIMNFRNAQETHESKDIVEGKGTMVMTLKALGMAVMLVWALISLSGISTFLYFNF